MIKRFTLTAENKEQVIPLIGQYLRNLDCTKPQSVVISEEKKKRTLPQNARLHKIIGMCAKESGYTVEQMKWTFKSELLEPVEWVAYKGIQSPIFKSTADMNTVELNTFMEGCENLAAQWYGIRLPAEE